MPRVVVNVRAQSAAVAREEPVFEGPRADEHANSTIDAAAYAMWRDKSHQSATWFRTLRATPHDVDSVYTASIAINEEKAIGLDRGREDAESDSK